MESAISMSGTAAEEVPFKSGVGSWSVGRREGFGDGSAILVSWGLL